MADHDLKECVSCLLMLDLLQQNASDAHVSKGDTRHNLNLKLSAIVAFWLRR